MSAPIAVTTSRSGIRLTDTESTWVGAIAVAAAVGGTGTGCGCGSNCDAVPPDAAGVVCAEACAGRGPCVGRGARTGRGWLLSPVSEVLTANPFITAKNMKNPTQPMLTNRCMFIICSPLGSELMTIQYCLIRPAVTRQASLLNRTKCPDFILTESSFAFITPSSMAAVTTTSCPHNR
jgi:hypothetical protein